MKFETESLREAIFVKRGLEYVLERESEQLEYICNNKQSLIEKGMDPDHYKQAVEKSIAELEDLIITATAKVMELTEQKLHALADTEKDSRSALQDRQDVIE